MKLKPIRRKLITIGNSIGVTLPSALLYKLDESKKYEVIFQYHKGSKDPEVWFISIKEVKK